MGKFKIKPLHKARMHGEWMCLYQLRDSLLATNFNPTAQMRQQEEQDNWKLLSKALHEIYRKNSSSLSFEECYRCAYNMVLERKGSELYRLLSATIEDHIVKDVLQNALLKWIPKQHSVDASSSFLTQVVMQWEEHQLVMTMIRDIFLFMDRVYIASSNLPCTYDMGMDLWREHVLGPIKKDLTQSILYFIHLARTRAPNTIAEEAPNMAADHETVVSDPFSSAQKLIKKVVEMELSLLPVKDHRLLFKTIYQQDFESDFVKVSSAYYAENTPNQINSFKDQSQYLSYCEKTIDLEKSIVHLYLIESSLRPLLFVVQEQLLTAQMSYILNPVYLQSLISQLKFNDLARLYRLLLLVRSQGRLAEKICGFIADEGKVINSTDTTETGSSASLPPFNPIRWCESLLSLKLRILQMLKEAFGGDSSYETAFDTALAKIIDACPKSCEFVASFMDNLMKNREEDLAAIDHAILIFKYLTDKDVFESFYKQFLAKRLLNGRYSEDREKLLMGKLKVECGQQLTSKFESMFNDIKLSAELSSEYHQSAALYSASTSSGSDLALNVTVITTGVWPSLPQLQMSVPLRLSMKLDSFRAFYGRKHSSRVLTWQHGLSQCTVKAFYPKGNKELSVSLAQAIVLLLYNEKETWTYEEIEARTGLIEPELVRTLQSLSVAKFRLITKLSVGKTVMKTDAFIFASDFSNPLVRLKIPTIALSVAASSKKEKSETLEKVEQDRKHLIEATIVRIMKARKSLDHNTLVGEVISQLSSRFKPSLQIIKARIETLIEREYLERSDDDRKYYTYLA